MRIIAFIFFLLFAASSAYAAPCKTEREVRADAVVGFFSAQKIAAEICETRKDFWNVVKLELMVYQKFKTRIDAAGKTRALFFVRIYGKRWLEEILMVNEAFKSLIARNFKATLAICSRLPSELARQITGGWAYVGPQVEQIVKRRRSDPQLLICKST